MESNVPSEFQVVERENSTDSMYRSSPVSNDERLTAIRKELEYLNTMGKRFVAAFDRFQVHRALLAALRDLYSFSACCILLKGDPLELFIIPSYPLSASFLEVMIQRIVSAATVIDFPHVEAEQLASSAYLDAPDELALPHMQEGWGGGEIGSSLHIPLTVENRIMGMLSLFDERRDTFNTNLLQLTTMIADYAAVALENVRLRERENALWRQTEFERQRLELIIGSMAEGLLITDAQGAITSLNQSAQHLLAQANIDFQTEVPLHKLISTSDADWLPRLAEIVDQALNNKVVTNQELTIGESSETVPITLNISAAPLHDASGIAKRPIGVVAVLNDVTSIKQVERLKDDFVSVVSHELRTPLTAIKGYTQHLVRRMERRLRKARTTPENSALVNESPESYDLRSLNIVQSQTEHLERLVNDLLDLSQVQWGKLNLHYETFYLSDVLSESVRSAQVSAELHTVFLDIQAQSTTIMADRMRVEQVIGNILDNAIKYSPHGGKVTVRLENRDKEYLISIIDEGI